MRVIDINLTKVIGFRQFFAHYESVKNQRFQHRLRYALSGIRTGFRSEASFRAQSIFAVVALILLLASRPKPIWWALVALTTSAVLASELINTALEFVVDRLHPEQHPMIAKAKDCAAGAVLIFSIASLVVAAALIWDLLLELASR